MTMRTRTTTTLACDVCGDELALELGPTAAMVAARELGWRISRYVGEYGVRCPRHARVPYPHLGR